MINTLYMPDGDQLSILSHLNYTTSLNKCLRRFYNDVVRGEDHLSYFD